MGTTAGPVSGSLPDPELKTCPRCRGTVEVWAQICPECLFEWPQLRQDGTPMRVWTSPGICLAVLFGLGLLAWPALVLMSAFLFDNPSSSLEGLCDFIALTSLGYPLIYFAALWLYRKSSDRCEREWQRLLAWLLPAVPLLAWIVLFCWPR